MEVIDPNAQSYTAAQIAVIVGVPKRTVNNWIRSGHLPRLDTPGSRNRVAGYIIRERFGDLMKDFRARRA